MSNYMKIFARRQRRGLRTFRKHSHIHDDMSLRGGEKQDLYIHT